MKVNWFLWCIIGFISLSLNEGCSPKGGYQVLHFFFDGVPDSLQEINLGIDSSANRDSLKSVLNQTVNNKPEYYYHQPYYKQECTACHDKSARSNIIQAQPAVCYKCHENFQLKYKYLHGPVSGGYCTRCHSPHMSQYPKLIKNIGNSQCLDCHEKSQLTGTIAHNDFEMKECLDCHLPHGSDHKKLLKEKF
ncbi:MAG: cytochrome c3 family protein [Bacteroidales bacterium]